MAFISTDRFCLQTTTAERVLKQTRTRYRYVSLYNKNYGQVSFIDEVDPFNRFEVEADLNNNRFF